MCFHLHRINYQVLLWLLKNEIRRLPTVSDGMALIEAEVTEQETNTVYMFVFYTMSAILKDLSYLLSI